MKPIAWSDHVLSASSDQALPPLPYIPVLPSKIKRANADSPESLKTFSDAGDFPQSPYPKQPVGDSSLSLHTHSSSDRGWKPRDFLKLD